MFRKLIKLILFLPLAVYFNSLNVLSSQNKNNIDKVLEEKINKPFISYQKIENIVLNNLELKSLKQDLNLVFV